MKKNDVEACLDAGSDPLADVDTHFDWIAHTCMPALIHVKTYVL